MMFFATGIFDGVAGLAPSPTIAFFPVSRHSIGGSLARTTIASLLADRLRLSAAALGMMHGGFSATNVR
jgi:hypothetical protein